MLDGLVSGKVTAQPQKRVGNNNNVFVTIRVNTVLQNNETLNVAVIAFDHAVCQALMALDVGDSVSLTGSLVPKVWETKEGLIKPHLDMIAHAILTPYQIQKKHQATQTEE